MNSFQESYLDHGRSEFEEKRERDAERVKEERRERSEREELERMRGEIREVEMMLEMERASRDFMLSKFTEKPSQPRNNMDEVLSAAS